LGVPQNSTRDFIQSKYRGLAAIHHPDKGGDPATMAQINEAYRKALA